MTLEHFLNGPKRTKFENRENAEIPVNSVKSGLFWAVKTAKLRRISRCQLEMLYTYSSIRVLSSILKIVENSQLFLEDFEKGHF